MRSKCKILLYGPQKAYPCVKRRHLTYWSWKSVHGAWLNGITRTPPPRKKQADSLRTSLHAWGQDLGSKNHLPDRNEILHRVEVPDNITHAKFVTSGSCVLGTAGVGRISQFYVDFHWLSLPRQRVIILLILTRYVTAKAPRMCAQKMLLQWTGLHLRSDKFQEGSKYSGGKDPLPFFGQWK